jgi:hypothetical protein
MSIEQAYAQMNKSFQKDFWIGFTTVSLIVLLAGVLYPKKGVLIGMAIYGGLVILGLCMTLLSLGRMPFVPSAMIFQVPFALLPAIVREWFATG